MNEKAVEETEETIVLFNELIQKKIISIRSADELEHLQSAVYSLAQLINAFNGIEYRKRLSRSG